VPESKGRAKRAYTPPSKPAKAKVGNPPWFVPVMLTLMVVGLLWIVVFYLVPDMKYLRDLGNWNLLVGMALISVGFVFATRWE
jgi:hypothetical protein